MALSTYMIGLCAYHGGTYTFETTVYVHCGRGAKYTCQIFMLILLFFSAVACLDVLQNQVDQSKFVTEQSLDWTLAVRTD